MKNLLLPTFPEVSSIQGSIHIRQDLTTHSITVYFKDWTLWDENTVEVHISGSLLHFIESDGNLAGIKAFSTNATQSSGVQL